jgi:F-type H+-transporting ATPase subunit b
MNIGVTLFGQMITFLIFVWFTKRYIFPPLMSALSARQAKIAEGLAAAARGHHDLELAQAAATKQLKEARETAVHIVEEAQKQAGLLVETAKQHAIEESNRILDAAEKEIGVMREQAKEGLRAQVASLALSGAEKILLRHVDAAANQDLLDKLADEL